VAGSLLAPFYGDEPAVGITDSSRVAFQPATGASVTGGFWADPPRGPSHVLADGVSAALGRLGVAEDFLCLLPGVLVEFQRFGAHLGQALRAQLDDVH
jgi:hypothetical protein